MKIALVIDSFSVGGGIINLSRLAKGMPDVEFGIFARKGKHVQLFKELENVTVFDKGYTPNYIASFKPDLVHINHLKPLLGWFGRTSPQPIPVIFTAHGLHVHKYEFQNGILSKMKLVLRKNLEKFLFKKCSNIVAVSKADKKYLENHYGLTNVVYLPNGIDPEIISGSTKRESNFVNFSKNSFVFLTIARFDFQKGYDILIEAISLVNNSLPENVCFVLVGGGPLIDEIKSRVKQRGLERRVIFMGEKVNNHHLWTSAHAFILPSRWEGLPTVILEAGLYKKPVIASATYGNTELIEHGKTGLLFPNEDVAGLEKRILEAINNYKPFLKMGENLYHLVTQDYNIEKMISRYRQLYESCVS
jgi:glycosyltransferase involved in cell wall biosynthesis